MSELMKAFECDATSSTTHNCFMKAGFKTDTKLDVSESNTRLSDLKEKCQQLKNMGSFEKVTKL